ncbi:GDP-Man:Man(3)GlcNAc(2)-PP-Dol alpha-1,2-mannosyltransferase [Thamnocephalis sphaerospora]|uniref:GDP-Man:Man(3)GlcNAc(2)-PP-Dol alpha-1,2-mannosyltransferase n=1 Tax=Thamnocephalis sphaerospora TaxID=78915 RepID=A0A4P9XU23_9FUNG|nr:GDP-Man:Man(3)GlcNAc(2)-PP-Dol alpha-1,2-mannosyltransferase [Thamnocephalis sphaerospora]|eukprot:RKP09707.1 GDP-Man:Man(3)GlcNAc(2)-PP-Dol alpha-1,2-mannosyltransferase [Thamnocephalis sphaerospora]
MLFTLFSLALAATLPLALVAGALLYFRIHLNVSRAAHRRAILQQVRIDSRVDKAPFIVGFFHPYCNAGGGGERVLWTAVEALLHKYAHVVCVLYTGDVDVDKEAMLAKTKSRFNIDIPADRLVLLHLHQRHWVEDKRYPRFTLLGQSLGSMLLGWEALDLVIPDLFIDSMGYAFTFPLVKLAGGCAVATYVHYPTISTDMIEKVSARKEGANNHGTIARSPALSSAKLGYYRLFAKLYSLVGSCADVVMVNSSWTRDHVEHLWNRPAQIVYPPCDTEALGKLPLANRQRILLSIGQFRPEKDHALQVRALKRLFELEPSLRTGPDSVRLVLLGSCRHKEDEARVEALRVLAAELSVQDNVEFAVNVPYELLLKRLSEATVGVHTMWNEHFGIGVVEYMAAGLIPVAHDSAGPKMDIVTPYKGKRTGYLAHDEDGFAHAILNVLRLPEEERLHMQQHARDSSLRFRADEFSSDFMAALSPVIA